MSEIISFPLPLGPNYTIPDVGDENWGQEVTNFLVAIPNGVMPTQGSFTLTGDVNLGNTFGLVAAHFISAGTSPSLSGFLRLAKTETLSWRNNANTADLPLGINGSDLLTFNGVTMGFSGGVGTANQYQLAYYAATGNSVAGLTLITGNKALASDVHGLPIASSTTDTELGYVHGVTSAIQTQLNSISTVANAALPEAGGTMSGPIAMGSNKITGLANGTNPGDAVNLSQVPTNFAMTGEIRMWPTASAPSGWVFCDGTSYTTAGQPALFAVIGYVYGGVGANFNVPNFTNNVPIGPGSIAALAATAGAQTVTALQNAHTHTDSGHQHIGTAGQNGATIFVPTTSGGGAWPYGFTSVNATNTVVAGTNDGATPLNYANTSTNSANISSNTATNQAASVIQPVLGINFIIKL